MGLLEARQEHYDTAINFYRRAIATDPNFPGLQMNLGLTLFKAGQFPDAIKSFASEIRKHPGDQRLTILMGMAHYGMKDYLVAIPYLQQALQHDRGNATLQIALARSCMSSKQYSCVVEQHDILVALHSDSTDVDLLTAEALQAMNRPEDAVSELKAALQSNPNEPKLHFALGFVLWSAAKWSEAADEFQLDLQNNPQDAGGHIYLADCLLHEKRSSQALSELEKVSATDPSDPLLHLDLGIIYMDSSRMDDALRELKIAAESDPENANLHRQIAKLYQAIGKGDEAKEEYESANRMSQAHHSLEQVLEPVAP
jgi:tetratricopeptide (TPR) repeat protein